MLLFVELGKVIHTCRPQFKHFVQSNFVKNHQILPWVRQLSNSPRALKQLILQMNAFMESEMTSKVLIDLNLPDFYWYNETYANGPCSLWMHDGVSTPSISSSKNNDMVAQKWLSFAAPIPSNLWSTDTCWLIPGLIRRSIWASGVFYA